MKKIYILLILTLLLSSCNKGTEFNEKNIKAEKNITFNDLVGNLDYENAGTPKYNKSLKYGEILDVSQEVDYEKYLRRYYLKENRNLENYNLENMPYVLRAMDFLKNNVRLDDVYKHIAVYYINRENLNIFNFNEYILPYNSYDEIYDETYEKYIIGAEATRIINLSLLKARNIIKYALENNLADENNKIKAQANLMIALSYLAQDRLYNILEIKKYTARWKELGGLNVENFGKYEDEKLSKLLTYIAYNDNIGIEEILKDGTNLDFLDLVISSGGVYNYLNDNFYMPVGVAKRNKKYSLNPFFEKYNDYIKTTSIIKKFLDNNNLPSNDTTNDYNFQNNFDILYHNNIYILPINHVVYTVEISKNKVIKAEFRNPTYFNVNYNSTLWHKGSRKILSEYNYEFSQKDYIINDNNSLKIVWNGDIRNQSPDSRKLFTFKNIIDCLNPDDVEKLEIICGNRENMIYAKYIHKKICGDVDGCLIKGDDVLGDYE